MQKEGEPVEDYLVRFHAVFDDFSGMPRPADYPGANMTSYEALLKTGFLEGMHSLLDEATKNSCIGWTDSSVRLADVLRQARHEQTRQSERYIKEEKKEKDTLHQAQLRLLQHVAPAPAPGLPTTQPYYRTDVCFYCSGTGHWARTCYAKNLQRRGRDRGRGLPPRGRGYGGYRGPPPSHYSD